MTIQTRRALRPVLAEIDRLSADLVLRAGHLRHGARTGIWSATVKYVQGPDGALEISYCTDCRYVEAFCAHTKCTWNTEETVLTCDVCGVDAT